MEIEHIEVLSSFFKANLKALDFDEDAYLEKLIIHWGETGEETFTLPADETISGKPEAIAFSVKNRYFIRENGEEIPIEDLSEGFDTYRPVLCFDKQAIPAPIPNTTSPHAPINPMEVLRYKCGKSLKDVSAASGVSIEQLQEYETPGYDMASIPLGTASAISKALNVHAEALLTCAPALPRNR